MKPVLKYLVVSTAYLACYFALAALSFGLWTDHRVLPWYPQAGLGLGILLVFGRKFVPVIFLAAFLSGYFLYPAKLGLVHSVSLGLATSLGYGAGVEFLTRLARIDVRLQHARDVWWCLVLAAVLPIFVGAAGLGAFVAAGDMKPRDYLPALGEWWLGDSIGILTLLPVMLAVILPKIGVGGTLAPDQGAFSDLQARAAWEIPLQVGVVMLCLFAVFGWSRTDGLHLAHLLFLPLIWIVSRHGFRGAAWGVALISAGVNLSQMFFSGGRYHIIELQTLMLGMAAAALLMGMVVSERERGKRSLASSKRTSEAVLDAIPDVMFRMKGDGTYLDYHAPEGTRFLVPPERFLNHTASEVLEPSLARMTMDSIANALAAGGVAQGEYTVPGELGARHFETRVVPVDRDEVLCLVRDITQRKRLEADLIRSQKLDAVGHLATGIAHDFNNLLAAIFGYVGIARAKLAPGDPTLDLLEGVEASARQAAGVVRSLVTFTRKSAPEMGAVDLCESVRRVAKLLRPTLPSSLSLSVEVSGGDSERAHIYLRGDDSQLQQVVLNLALNARDAMPGGGVIRLCLGVEPAAEPGAPMATLRVTDTGVGIEPANLPRIFEPYYSTKSKDESSGLGLAITDGIVKAHGGTITVRSERGVGTTFSVRLPLDPHPPAAAGRPTVAPARPAWVLVADTHRQVREFLASGLAHAGFAVEQADGIDSVRVALHNHPHFSAAILSADGTGVADWVRSIDQVLPSVPIIVLASNPEIALADAPEEVQSRVRVIGKPFQILDLVALVGVLVGVPSADEAEPSAAAAPELERSQTLE